MEEAKDTLTFSFQWAVDDMRPLERSLISIARPRLTYVATVVARILAYALTFAVAFALIPNASWTAIVLIAFTGSLSVWVAWGVSVVTIRKIEKLLAHDTSRVGWNYVVIDRSGITWNTDVSQEYCSWLGVTEVADDNGAVLLKTGKVQGYYLPPRILGTKDELAQHIALIRKLRSEATQPAHLAQGNPAPLIKH